jgi:hypothetical protein
MRAHVTPLPRGFQAKTGTVARKRAGSAANTIFFQRLAEYPTNR